VRDLLGGVRGKALVLSIGLLLTGGSYFSIVAPIVTYYERSAQRLEERAQLARRYQGLAQDLPRLRSAATQRLDKLPDGGLLWTGSTDAVAAATLQSALKELVEREGAKLTTAEMLPAESYDSARRLGVRIAFLGDLSLLTRVLAGVETTHPLLSVGKLALRKEASPNDGSQSPTLSVTMDVYGLSRGRGG
jgi:hypothetical protein